MFGTATSSGGGGGFSFGNTTTNTTAGAASSSPFSFGGASTSAAPAASSGFSFGNANTTPASTATPSTGFSFGATPATPATSTAPTGFGFGSSTAAPATTTTTTPSFGFGASSGGFGSSAATTKPPLFGQKASTTTPGSTGFSFGSTPAATTTPSTTSFGGFGTKPSTGFGFGSTPASTAPTTTTGSLFGSNATTSTFGGFGSTAGAAPTATSSVFGTPPVASSAPPPIICGADASVAQLNTIKYAYQDPAQSRFKFLMYNTVDPTQRHLYVRPPHISERLWDQAELDNPDPLHCVPVPILGFQDLMKRIQVQQNYADKYNKYTDDLRNQLKEMEKASRATEEKLEKCRLEHVQLFHSLVKVMKDIEFLQNLGKPLQKQEMELAMALKKLQALLDAPSQYKARLNDVVALQRIQENPTSATAFAIQASNQLRPDDLQKVYHFLDKQRQGLEHLTSILNDDLADIKLMKETWRR